MKKFFLFYEKDGIIVINSYYGSRNVNVYFGSVIIILTNEVTLLRKHNLVNSIMEKKYF